MPAGHGNHISQLVTNYSRASGGPRLRDVLRPAHDGGASPDATGYLLRPHLSCEYNNHRRAVRLL